MPFEISFLLSASLNYWGLKLWILIALAVAADVCYNLATHKNRKMLSIASLGRFLSRSGVQLSIKFLCPFLFRHSLFYFDSSLVSMTLKTYLSRMDFKHWTANR